MSTLKAYITGFVLSILLTVAAYFLVAWSVKSGIDMLSNSNLTFAVLVLAVIQFVVQLVLFLHLGREKKPRWNLAVFAATITLVLIVIIGSIWIMNHLNYNMTPAQIQRYLVNGQGAGF